MDRTFDMPRMLIPVLGLAGLALVATGLPAQEQERQEEERPSRAAVRAAPMAPSLSLRMMSGGSHLGVYIREVTDEDVGRLDLSEEYGALITDVPEGGPAAEAGLQADDVIVSWNGSRVEGAAQLRRLVTETPAGRSAELGYVRDGRERAVTVELAERPSIGGRLSRHGELDAEQRARLEESLDGVRGRLRGLGRHDGGFAHAFMSGGRLGVAIQSLGDQLAEYFDASEGGVLVSSVREESPAAAAGLRAGDVVVRIGDRAVEDPRDLVRAIARAEAGEIELEIIRDGEVRTLRADLPERPEGMGSAGSGSVYYFGPRAGTFDLDMPDGMGRFEIQVPEIPELELLLPDPPTPLEPSVRT